MSNPVSIDYQDVSILLPSYDGNKKTLHFYIKCVENVIDMIENKDDQSLACLIVNKLTGRAVEALSERNNFKTWKDIKQILTQRFGEYRSEVELTQDLIKLNKDRDNMETFTDKIRELTCNLINSGSQSTEYYEKLAISVLLDQINPIISIMVRTQKMENLEEVIALVKIEDLKYTKYRNARSQNFIKPINKQPTYQKPNIKLEETKKHFPKNNFNKIKQEKLNFQSAQDFSLEDTSENGDETENFQEELEVDEET